MVRQRVQCLSKHVSFRVHPAIVSEVSLGKSQFPLYVLMLEQTRRYAERNQSQTMQLRKSQQDTTLGMMKLAKVEPLRIFG